MTTTLSAPPATPSNPSPSGSPPVVDSRRGPLVRLGLPLAFVLIAVFSLLAYASVWRGTVADEPIVHRVQRRDLPIVLEEKGELEAYVNTLLGSLPEVVGASSKFDK